MEPRHALKKASTSKQGAQRKTLHTIKREAAAFSAKVALSRECERQVADCCTQTDPWLPVACHGTAECQELSASAATTAATYGAASPPSTKNSVRRKEFSWGLESLDPSSWPVPPTPCSGLKDSYDTGITTVPDEEGSLISAGDLRSLEEALTRSATESSALRLLCRDLLDFIRALQECRAHDPIKVQRSQDSQPHEPAIADSNEELIEKARKELKIITDGMGGATSVQEPLPEPPESLPGLSDDSRSPTLLTAPKTLLHQYYPSKLEFARPETSGDGGEFQAVVRNAPEQSQVSDLRSPCPVARQMRQTVPVPHFKYKTTTASPPFPLPPAVQSMWPGIVAQSPLASMRVTPPGCMRTSAPASTLQLPGYVWSPQQHGRDSIPCSPHVSEQDRARSVSVTRRKFRQCWVLEEEEQHQYPLDQAPMPVEPVASPYAWQYRV
eukprot:TRINITY_DN4671_c1_g2_i1.p1 TRINITY_DN4671_c1_g2~~TRINITY_DN4671_c1_g2_i1.p1  ORF type:complete len:441 (+),score=64.96 TRINITY_DN4671_c1_g2_i1:122-1444(+)